MNEITRIHLAKVAYDVELDAKKALEAYEKALRARLEDAGTLEDIEGRMVELLAERGVKAGGVITLGDVRGVRKQLGEPAEFGEEQQPVSTVGEEKPVRRLYRDLDNAMLGGVMSGIAAYFRFDPTLVRMVALILTVVSFGMAVLVYILLWILIPPAKSASQRLELAGKPVTLENINEVGDATLSQTARWVRRGLMIAAGLGAAMVAVGALIAVVYRVQARTVVGMTFGDFISSPLLLVAVAGVMLAMFMSVIAYGLIRQTWRRQLSFALVCITLVGMISFGVGMYGLYSPANYQAGWLQSTAEQKPTFYPADKLGNIKKLIVDSSVYVYYSIGKPSLSVMSLKSSSAPVVTIDGHTATVRYNNEDSAGINITGPALESVDVLRSGFTYTAQGGTMMLTLQQYSTATMTGSLAALQLNIQGNGATFDGDQLVVDQVKLAKNSDNVGEPARSTVTLATVRTLDITYPTSCASNTGLNVAVDGVTGQLTANEQTVRLPFEAGCFSLTQHSNSEQN